MLSPSLFHSTFFFFSDTATPVIYTLSLHDALPISRAPLRDHARLLLHRRARGHEPPVQGIRGQRRVPAARRSEEHTSELQSRQYLVCRLLLEKKKRKN